MYSELRSTTPTKLEQCEERVRRRQWKVLQKEKRKFMKKRKEVKLRTTRTSGKWVVVWDLLQEAQTSGRGKGVSAESFTQIFSYAYVQGIVHCFRHEIRLPDILRRFDVRCEWISVALFFGVNKCDVKTLTRSALHLIYLPEPAHPLLNSSALDCRTGWARASTWTNTFLRIHDGLWLRDPFARG